MSWLWFLVIWTVGALGLTVASLGLGLLLLFILRLFSQKFSTVPLRTIADAIFDAPLDFFLLQGLYLCFIPVTSFATVFGFFMGLGLSGPPWYFVMVGPFTFPITVLFSIYASQILRRKGSHLLATLALFIPMVNISLVTIGFVGALGSYKDPVLYTSMLLFLVALCLLPIFIPQFSKSNPRNSYL
jgi:hypothetical protein